MSIADRIYKNLIYDGRYLLIWEGVKTTLIITVFACLLGGLIGLLICSARMSKNKFIVVFAKAYIHFFRSIPIVLLLILTYYVVFANVHLSAITVSIIAFSFYHSAYVAEVFRSGLNSVDKMQIDVSVSMGFTKWQSFIHVILPQAIRVMFPVYRGEFMTLVKLTSIVGYVGVRDLTRATDIIRSQTFDALFPLVFAVIIYFIIIGVFSFILNMVEKIIYPRKRVKA
jgi:polar amino acid transport system substrate-binding protein